MGEVIGRASLPLVARRAAETSDGVSRKQSVTTWMRAVGERNVGSRVQVAIDTHVAGMAPVDLLDVDVLRPKVLETTALGAARLAGLATGVWESTDEIAEAWRLDRRFSSEMAAEKRDPLYAGWLRAVERSRDWVE